MKRTEKRFQVKRFVFETDSGGMIERYMITDNLLPLFAVNQWIEAKSLRSVNTGKEYAYKLSVYLNYLENNGLDYDQATNKTVNIFIHQLIYGNLEDLKIRSINAGITYSTLSKYVTVITEFYKWLADCYEVEMGFGLKPDPIRARKSFLYDYKYIISRYLPVLNLGGFPH